MGFDIEKNRVVGIIDHRLKYDGARIKVIGYLNLERNLILLNEEDLKNEFPPIGFIFGYKFFIDNSMKEGDMIEFKIEDAQNEKDHGDSFKIQRDTKVKLWGRRIFEVENFNINNSFIELFKISLPANVDYTHSFYVYSNNRIYGKLKLHNSSIIPDKGHYFYEWLKEQCEIFTYKDNHYLLDDQPKGHYNNLIDSMDDHASFYWFKSKLKLLSSDAVNLLNSQVNWGEFAEKIVNQDTDKTIVEKNRLKRICNNLDQQELLAEEIRQISKISKPLENSFNAAIERHKNELRSEYAKDIEELEKNKEFEKQKLEQTLSKICIEIAHKNNALVDLETKIKEKNAQLEHIEENKERILSDFSIIKEVLGGSTSQTEQVQSNSFVIETIIPPDENILLIEKRDKFSARLRYILSEQNLNSSLAANLLAATATFKGTFIKDEQLAIALIEATGNCKYIIQQVEPDWLHFKDFWNNGLEAIWKSSHENPDILHFLVLEDINLSSPECYMRPLLDCMNGIRKRIPFASNEFPENLRIFATKTSTDEPKIGLPLYEQTFKKWGAVGFAEPIDKISEQKHSAVEGYIDSITFSTFKMDDFELKTDSLALSSQFQKLFDRPE